MITPQSDVYHVARQNLATELPPEGHAHWSRVPIMSVLKMNTPALGGGFATHSNFIRLPS